METANDTDGTPGIRRGPRAFFALIVVLALAAWPFLGFVDAVPVQPDSMKWIERGAPGAEGWSAWVFETSHFVGYRPLTAISFTWDLQLFGPCAIGLRATDLGLHLLVVALVFLLARRLATPWVGVLAALIFAVHPGADEVVPYLARRSYSLAAAGALSGLALASVAVRGGRVSFLLCGPMLLLGMLGNELGAVLALALPAVAWGASAAESRRRALGVTVWGWSMIGLGVALRQRVVGDESGYAIEGGLLERGSEVAGLYGAALAGRLDDAGGAWTIAFAGVAAYYAFVVLRLAAGRPRDLLPLGLMLTLVAYGLIVASQGVWFPRQVYPAAALLAVLAAIVAARTLGADTTRRWVHVVPQVTLLAVLLHGSPMIVGTARGHLEETRVATAFVDGVESSVSDLEPTSQVHLVVPLAPRVESGRAHLRPSFPEGRARRAPAAIRWLQMKRPDDTAELLPLAYIEDAESHAAPSVKTERPIEVVMPEGARCFRADGIRMIALADDERTVRLDGIARRGPPVYVWVNRVTGDPPGDGALIQVREERRRRRRKD